MGRKCEQFTDADFIAYIQGNCAPEKKEALEAHLKDCFSCNVRMEGLKKGGKAMMESLPAPKVPSDVETQIEKAVMKRFGRAVPFFSTPFWIGMAIGILLFLIIGFVVVSLRGLDWKPEKPITQTQQPSNLLTNQTSVQQEEMKKILERLKSTEEALEKERGTRIERETEIEKLNNLLETTKGDLESVLKAHKDEVEKFSNEKQELSETIKRLQADSDAVKGEKDSLVAKLSETEALMRVLAEKLTEEQATTLELKKQIEDLKRENNKQADELKGLSRQLSDLRSMLRTISDDRLALERQYCAALDVDGDGTLTVGDVDALLRKVAADDEIRYNKALDLNNDGRIDVADALRVMRFLQERKNR